MLPYYLKEVQDQFYPPMQISQHEEDDFDFDIIEI